MKDPTCNPAWLIETRSVSPEPVLEIADYVWQRRDLFICWPRHALLLWPGTTRSKDGYTYPDELKVRARAAKVPLDRRSNGPAIAAYRLAGGIRPSKTGIRHGWSVHHIYDGLHPAPNRVATAHAIKRGDLFTEAAGLVALHPVADALASEVPFFAWHLRFEAYVRYRFDPDSVFDDGGPVVPAGAVRRVSSQESTVQRGDVPTMSEEPKVCYRSTRLHFKASAIEPLADDDVFEIQTPDATWRMTKAQFYATFPNVVASKSYAGERREYFYTSPPGKANIFLV